MAAAGLSSIVVVNGLLPALHTAEGCRPHARCDDSIYHDYLWPGIVLIIVGLATLPATLVLTTLFRSPRQPRTRA